jgi:hypothetical protein
MKKTLMKILTRGLPLFAVPAFIAPTTIAINHNQITLNNTASFTPLPDLNYTVSGNTISITGAKDLNNLHILNLPETYEIGGNTFSVSEIANNAFY